MFIARTAFLGSPGILGSEADRETGESFEDSSKSVQPRHAGSTVVGLHEQRVRMNRMPADATEQRPMILFGDHPDVCKSWSLCASRSAHLVASRSETFISLNVLITVNSADAFITRRTGATRATAADYWVRLLIVPRFAEATIDHCRIAFVAISVSLRRRDRVNRNDCQGKSN